MKDHDHEHAENCSTCAFGAEIRELAEKAVDVNGLTVQQTSGTFIKAGIELFVLSFHKLGKSEGDCIEVGSNILSKILSSVLEKVYEP